MKKFLLIPAVALLIAGLLITCDTGGDWSNPSSGPGGPGGPGAPSGFDFNGITGTAFNVDGGNLEIHFDPVLNATGKTHIKLTFENFDSEWWVGGQVDSHDEDDPSATTESTGWYQVDAGLNWNVGTGVMIFDLDAAHKQCTNDDGNDPSCTPGTTHLKVNKATVRKVVISGGGGTMNPGFLPETIKNIELQ